MISNNRNFFTLLSEAVQYMLDISENMNNFEGNNNTCPFGSNLRWEAIWHFDQLQDLILLPLEKLEQKGLMLPSLAWQRILAQVIREITGLRL